MFLNEGGRGLGNTRVWIVTRTARIDRKKSFFGIQESPVPSWKGNNIRKQENPPQQNTPDQLEYTWTECLQVKGLRTNWLTLSLSGKRIGRLWNSSLYTIDPFLSEQPYHITRVGLLEFGLVPVYVE